MEILEMLENLRAEEASIDRLFGKEGVGVRHLQRKADYQRKLVEATQFIADVFDGKRPTHHLREAMTTSDFPLLFGDVLDRQVLANYREWPSIWPAYVARSTVPDFRAVSRFAISGAESVLDEVEEQAEYPAAALAEAEYTYFVRKYGRRLPFSWEAMINDDLESLTRIPERFGKAARRSEDKFATQLHVGTAGPLGTVYSAPNGNIITGNPVLGLAGLQVAFTILGNMLDGEGEPIVMDMVILEVPPALEITARNILNATELWLTGAGGETTQELVVQNWMKNRLQLVVNPYIPIICTSNDNTTWFLHASPSNGRPAFEMGFLRGHTEPEIFIKEPNARRVGGGTINPLDGDFDTDSIDYKVRHVFGGAVIDPKMTVGSNGSAT